MVCALAIPHTSLYNLYVLAELIVAQGFHYFICAQPSAQLSSMFPHYTPMFP